MTSSHVDVEVLSVKESSCGIFCVHTSVNIRKPLLSPATWNVNMTFSLCGLVLIRFSSYLFFFILIFISIFVFSLNFYFNHFDDIFLLDLYGISANGKYHIFFMVALMIRFCCCIAVAADKKSILRKRRKKNRSLSCMTNV